MAKQALSTKDLMTGFGVGHMTIFNWRKGGAKKDPLPCDISVAGRVSYKLGAVKAWAKTHGLKFEAPVTPAEEGKPGPKATAAKKAPAKKVVAQVASKGKARASVKAKFARVAKKVEAQQASA